MLSALHLKNDNLYQIPRLLKRMSTMLCKLYAQLRLTGMISSAYTCGKYVKNP